MEPDLYFLPLLIRALDAPDPAPALKNVFAEIVTLGRQEAYREGYEQFMAFMDRAVRSRERYHQAGEDAIAPEKDVSSAEFQNEALLLDRLFNNPEAKRLLEELNDDAASLAVLAQRVLMLEQDAQPRGRIEFAPGVPSAPLGPLAPGRYTLKMPTGRVLWEKTLAASDVLLTASSAESVLKMAAATKDEAAPPSVEALLLGGQLVLQIYRGVRGGQLIIGDRGSTDATRR